MDLQAKASEIFRQYEGLPMQDRIGAIARAFGCTSGRIETSPCTGKWRGTSDMSIRFDNGVSLFIGNVSTPAARTLKARNRHVDAALLRFNPEIVAITKETALAALREREARDSEIAVRKGLEPYTLLNVEFNDGADGRNGGYLGWYYVTIAVNGRIRAHMETGLSYGIACGKAGEGPQRNYFAAGAVKEADVDYIFHNVGFSSASALYSLPLAADVLKRAEKTLAERVETRLRKAV